MRSEVWQNLWIALPIECIERWTKLQFGSCQDGTVYKWEIEIQVHTLYLATGINQIPKKEMLLVKAQ